MTIHSFLVETPTDGLSSIPVSAMASRTALSRSGTPARERFWRTSPPPVARPTQSTRCFALTPRRSCGLEHDSF